MQSIVFLGRAPTSLFTLEKFNEGEEQRNDIGRRECKVKGRGVFELLWLCFGVGSISVCLQILKSKLQHRGRVEGNEIWDKEIEVDIGLGRRKETTLFPVPAFCLLQVDLIYVCIHKIPLFILWQLYITEQSLV